MPISGAGSTCREALNDVLRRSAESIEETASGGGVHLRHGCDSGKLIFRKASSWLSDNVDERDDTSEISLSTPLKRSCRGDIAVLSLVDRLEA